GLGESDEAARSTAAQVGRGRVKGRSSPQPQNRPPAALQPRSARPTAGATATRYRDRSTGNTPASAGCGATASLDGSPADVPTRTDRVPASHTDDTPANTRPTAAGGAVPSHRAAPARHSHQRRSEFRDRPETVPAGGAVGCLHQRLRSTATKPPA